MFKFQKLLGVNSFGLQIYVKNVSRTKSLTMKLCTLFGSTQVCEAKMDFIKTFTDLDSEMTTLTAWWESSALTWSEIFSRLCPFSQWNLMNNRFEFMCTLYLFSCTLKVLIKKLLIWYLCTSFHWYSFYFA